MKDARVFHFFYLRNVNVWLTFDYELFFGKPSGTVEKCMIEPTKRLMRLSEQFQAPFTYFVDAGFLFKINELGVIYPELKQQHQDISKQLTQLVASGNDVQLHIHPHWELSNYKNGVWSIPQNFGYRLDEFSADEALAIFSKYKNHLDEIIGQKTIAYRAGGWCIQPFNHTRKSFLENGILYDSSIVPGMIFHGGVYNIDFTNAPKHKDQWNFLEQPTQENQQGPFCEIPISSQLYKPLFYWELYIRGRLNKQKHKFVGDGNFIPQPGRKWQTLTQSQWNHVSCDGFYSKKLLAITKSFLAAKREHLVVIGHPKSMSQYSFHQLELYLQRMSGTVKFQTFKKYHAENC